MAVSGSGVTVTVVFEAVYTVTFTETGVSSGTAWSITLNGTTENASAPASISFAGLKNASYAYTVTASGYQTLSGTVPVNGPAQPVSVTISPNSSSPGLPWWVYAIIGVAVVVVLVVIGLVVLRRRRSGPPSGTPPSSSPPAPPS